MMSDETIIFGSLKDVTLAKAAGVSPSTIGRWRRHPDSIPLGELRKMLKVKGYTVRFHREEREYE